MELTKIIATTFQSPKQIFVMRLIGIYNMSTAEDNLLSFSKAINTT